MIDELISGTDPKEAQAISLSILDKLKEKSSTFIITTHFDDIKNYSYEDEQIMLSSVGFDMETLTPTYRYLEDSVGASNALEIASRYFDDQQIIENARHYLEKNKSDHDEMMDRLSKQIEETEKEKEKLAKEKQEYEKEAKEYREKIAAFESEKDALRKKYLEELNDYIEEVKLEALEKLDSIKEVKNKDVVEQINELKPDKVETKKKEERPLQVGDNVRIKDNEQIGVISAILGNKATISLRGLTVKANINELTLMPKIKKQETKVTAHKYKRVPGRSIWSVRG